MPASRQLLWWALLTCCRGAASAVDDDAFTPIPDKGKEIFARDSGLMDFDRPGPILIRAKEISAPDSGFGDPDASAPVQDQAKTISAPDSGFADGEASALIQDQTKEMFSPDSGFSYLKRKRYQALKEKLREFPLPNEKLLPHLTNKFVTLMKPRNNYPMRLREVHIGGDKDLMNGVKLFRSARPEHNLQTPSEHADTMPSDNPQTRRGSTDAMSSDNSHTHRGSTDATSSDNSQTHSGSTDATSSDSSQTHSGSTDATSSDSSQTHSGSTDATSSDNSQTHRGSTDATSSDNSQTHRGNTDAMPSSNPQTRSKIPDTTSSDSSDGDDGVPRIADVSFLRELNVKNIINLNAFEFSPDSQLLLRNAGIHVEHIPILDWKTPTSQQISNAIESIENARRSGASSWVFCGYGDGRSGTIVAAYEISKIFQAYPDLSPTDLQTYVMRRNGYIKIAHGMLSDIQVSLLINRYNTHKVETVGQVDALLAFANQISAQTKCIDI